MILGQKEQPVSPGESRACTHTKIHVSVQLCPGLASSHGVTWPLQPGLPGPGNTICLENFPALLCRAISFPSSPHKILPPMMDAIPSWEGGRKENTKWEKNPLVNLGKAHGHITWEKKASEVLGLPSSAAQAVHCPTPRGGILMD